MEWNLGDAARYHGILAIYNILKVLNQTRVQRVNIVFAMDKFKQTIVLINRQILNQLTLNCVGLLVWLDLSQKCIKDLLESRMSTLDQVL